MWNAGNETRVSGRFFKGHGLGNDYIALDTESLSFSLTPPAIRLICDRHRGIGSDGILARVPSHLADFGLRIYNPDGSEAEKSGNGLRIFAAYLLHETHVTTHSSFTVETPGGVVAMEILGESPTGAIDVRVEMGRASFQSADVGLAGPEREVDGEMLELEAGDRVTITTVSLGNPHCVIFEDEVDVDDLRRRAPQISTHPSFTRGTNVQFARAIDPGVVEAWVWERGAGETLASGSSACAVAAAALKRGLVSDREIEVRMPGGSLFVEIGEDWSVVLRGPAEGVFVGEFFVALIRRIEEL
ncbi:MAG TPA: diaminopimelate epimerase [Longimicrobiaceae bacterium]|nr:diaminopimelate epimerase [Longimicrobiaceae bacterium]